jgi:hypothetical protein
LIWFRKFAALLLLCGGAALVFLPWPAQISGERIENVVWLGVGPAPFTEESARTRFGESFIELGYEGMAGFPEVREAILGVAGESYSSRCVPSAEWKSMLADRSVVDPEGAVFAFRDGLYQITSAEAKEFGPEGELVCFETTMLGMYDNHAWSPMARLEAGDLDKYPELKEELERLAAGPIPAEGESGISPRRWRRFQSREVDERGYRPHFVVFDRLYSGWLMNATVPWTLRTPWLRLITGAFGTVAAFLALYLGVASYRTTASRPGIPVASPWLMVFCDAISLIGASIFVVLAIDTLWVGPIGQPSLIGLQPEWPSTQPITGLHFISIPIMLVVLPLLTLWFTSLTAQRIHVDAERVTSYGALGSTSIAWQDLERVRLREQKNPFAFTVVDFRSLQKVVDLEGGEYSVTINEPGSRKRKVEILGALRQYAPEDKMDLINVLGEW